jgi:hypothetical protein
MRVIESVALVAGFVLLPAALTIVGGFVLNWLERRHERQRAVSADVDAVWRLNRAVRTALAVPLAALSAAMVLAPAVFAVAAVVANELAMGYLVTAGFALGALALNGLAATTAPSAYGPRWSGVPGVLLSSAVGFTVALMSLLGGALAATFRVPPGDSRRVWVTLGVALLLGSLAYGAYRRREREVEAPAPTRIDVPAPAGSRAEEMSAEGRVGG